MIFRGCRASSSSGPGVRLQSTRWRVFCNVIDAQLPVPGSPASCFIGTERRKLGRHLEGLDDPMRE
jgi:hypothetical protein